MSKKTVGKKQNDLSAHFLDKDGNTKKHGVKKQLTPEEILESAKRKRRVNFKELLALGVIPWESWKTTKRKIDNEQFPAYCVSGYYSFDISEVEMWLKKRKIDKKVA